MNKKGYGIILITIALFLLMGLVIGYSIYNIRENPQEQLSGLANEPYNLIGSLSGTTTTAVSFQTPQTASSSYPVYLGNEVDQATIVLGATTVNPEAFVSLSILGSNDLECDTATTSYDMISEEPALVDDIKWHNIHSNIKGASGITTLDVGTSTLTWLPTDEKQITHIELTDLNTRCLAVKLSASSTTLWAQVITKQHN